MSEPVTVAPAPGLVVRWQLAAGSDGGPRAPGWELDGNLRPEFTMLRVLSALLEDGSMLLLAAARPAGGAAHNDEQIAAVLVDGSGELAELDEVLISTEYADDGTVRRVGLELYRPGEDYPRRAAADSLSTERRDEVDLHTDAATMSLRLDGMAGTALYEIVRPR